MPTNRTTDHVLTLVAGTALPALPTAVVGRVLDALTQAGAQPGAPDELAPGRACDIPLRLADGPDAATVNGAVRAALGQTPVDAVLMPADGRKKRLLVTDMESTIIREEMLDELGGRLGLRDRIAAITERAMNGELDFRAALEQRVALLAGQRLSVLDDLTQAITPTPGAARLIATMRARGAHCVLVSGGFHPFTGAVCERLGFDACHGNRFEVDGDRLTGRILDPLVDRTAKRRVLEETAAALGLSLAATLAVGDGANDLEMLSAAGLGVAFHPKPAVAAAAPAQVRHADLTALLYLQGYRPTDFAPLV